MQRFDFTRLHSAHHLVINEDTGFAYIEAASMGGETGIFDRGRAPLRKTRRTNFAGRPNPFHPYS